MSTTTLDGSTKNKAMETVLLDLIRTLEDSQKGFADIGEHLKDITLKRFFLAESLKRANFRAELENELHRAGMADVKEGGTVAGALHRTWGDLKAKLGGGDHGLLETAERAKTLPRKPTPRPSITISPSLSANSSSSSRNRSSPRMTS